MTTQAVDSPDPTHLDSLRARDAAEHLVNRRAYELAHAESWVAQAETSYRAAEAALQECRRDLAAAELLRDLASAELRLDLRARASKSPT